MTDQDSSAAARDDRVFGSTRVLGAVIVPFLLVAFALLYFFPDDTRHYFAWDVQPTITPLVMGAGYIAGAYFFARVARETRWHRIHVGFLPGDGVHAVHGDRDVRAPRSLRHGARRVLDLGRALRGDAGAGAAGVVAQPRERSAARRSRASRRCRAVCARRCSCVGGVQSAVALVLLLSPSTMIEHWPWLLTPLTAQTLGGWFALPGVTALMMGLDGRWSAIQITLESQLIGLALILLGTARAWEDVDTSNALAYVFVAGHRRAVRAPARAGGLDAQRSSASSDVGRLQQGGIPALGRRLERVGAVADRAGQHAALARVADAVATAEADGHVAGLGELEQTAVAVIPRDRKAAAGEADGEAGAR